VTATRTLVVRCPDWPVIAAGVPLNEPAAVFFANRVVASSPAARAEGVTQNMRRREAQGRCPELAVLEHDPARDARAFEPVVASLDVLTPRIEVSEPGQCAFPTHGPARYFGGDDQLATRAHALASGVLGDRGAVHVGVADGPFAAALAAAQHATVIVPPDMSPAFLAPWPLSALDRPELVDVLNRLGLRTLSDFAALPARDVLARFASDGATAHRLAAGLDDRPPATRPPPPELTVQAELDPPAERVDTAAFVGRALADELHARLSARGHVCTRLLIVAETEHNERLERLWRLDIAGTSAVPDELATAAGRQLGFWGGGGGADERVVRALARVEGLLGPDSVTVPEWCGGRGPGEQVRLVPAGVIDLTSERPSAQPEWRTEPWPGSLPAPSPATVPHAGVAAEVVDAAGVLVRVSGRGEVSSVPARLKVGDRPSCCIVAWSGPWPVDERWWDDVGHRRHARFQVVTDDGIARLVTIEGGRWRLAAVYD
jgi:protein ImuB